MTPKSEKLILVGPLPTADHITGQSVAFHVLVESLQERRNGHLDLRVIDIAGPENAPLWRRVFDYVGIFARFLGAVAGRPGRIYVTVGRSPRSFSRDLVLVFLGRLFRHRLIGHVHGGDYGLFYEAQGVLMRALIRFTLRRFDRMLVLSEGLRDMFAFEPSIASRVRAKR